MRNIGKTKAPARKADEKAKKPPPPPRNDRNDRNDDDYEDGDIATPKRDRYGSDDEPL